MKKTIRLTESELKGLLESVLREQLDNTPNGWPKECYKGPFYTINSCNDKLESLGLEDMGCGFKNGRDAFNAGFEELKNYDDGLYILNIHTFVKKPNGIYQHIIDSGYPYVNWYGRIVPVRKCKTVQDAFNKDDEIKSRMQSMGIDESIHRAIHKYLR